ncbi:ABC transporter substrate-binding protein [Chlamydiifrater phoenicopteri]|uniref:ABC transporter substrate-binding protein n=1 Tax=Chlamydiifrater phoenicopteri TaxID=2681469 RepID=UPI001BCE13CE|nr:ABC transporter substrate-binding protein [Chlamydiifrater phoenicopteri]
MKKHFFFDRVLSVLLLGALLLLYWSSDLLERDIKTVKGSVTDIRSDVRDIVSLIKQTHKSCGSPSSMQSLGEESRDIASLCCFDDKNVGDPSLPNLLFSDPYVSSTLPTLLGDKFLPKGVLRWANVCRPENLSPFNGFENIVRMYEICVPSLATQHVGKYEKFAPELAVKIEEKLLDDGSGDKEFRIYLRPNVFWHPIDPNLFPKTFSLHPMFLEKKPVTAEDFKFFYDVVMNPYVADMRAVSLRAYFEDIVSFVVHNDLEFSVRWKAHPVPEEDGKVVNKVQYAAFINTLCLQPLPSFVYKYFSSGEKIVPEDEEEDTYRVNSIWAQNFSTHWALNYIVSCGPYIFSGMDSERIRFLRNPDYFNPLAALVEEKIVLLRDSTDSLFQDFKAGNIDIAYLPPNHKENLESFMKSPSYQLQAGKGEGIRMVSSLDKAYSYVGWNCFSVFFQDADVRRAMNMAIDRNRIIDQVLGGDGFTISGPFSIHSPSYNHSVQGWPYSPEEASRLLEEAGWIDRDGDGIREKVVDGIVVPFQFRLCYYVKSVTSRTIAEYISTACKEIGVDCSLLGLDVADLSLAFEEKNFDAILMGWCLGSPPEDPRALWHSEGALEKGSANAVGFKNQEADAIIEKLSYEYDKEKRLQLYHRFHEIIHEEAPYTFLYSRNSILLYRDYVKNIFVPKMHTDLIPEAQDGVVNLSMAWLSKEEECLGIS